MPITFDKRYVANLPCRSERAFGKQPYHDQRKAMKHGIKLSNHFNDAPDTIRADERKLKQIELHGGKIWLESAGEGRGAAFSFTLPLADNG